VVVGTVPSTLLIPIAAKNVIADRLLRGIPSLGLQGARHPTQHTSRRMGNDIQQFFSCAKRRHNNNDNLPKQKINNHGAW